MAAYIVRRLAYVIFVVFGAVTLIFVVLRLVPGDPAIIFAGPSATAEQIEAIRTDLGMDKPLPAQYLSYLGNVLRLDLGRSYRLGVSAIEAVRSRLPATALLAFSSLALALLLGFPLGIIAALSARTRLDQVISLLSLLGQALPNFWIGIVFILVFARNLRLLPSAGYGTPRHLILPMVTLSLILLGVIVRLVRSGMIEVMNEPYILTARAKGLSPRVVVFYHAVRNMLIPVITLVGLQLGQLLSGTVVVEVVFGWPGIGRLLVDAITNRDYTVVQAVVMLMSATFVLINLVVDLLYGYLDPRVRLDAQ